MSLQVYRAGLKGQNEDRHISDRPGKPATTKAAHTRIGEARWSVMFFTMFLSWLKPGKPRRGRLGVAVCRFLDLCRSRFSNGRCVEGTCAVF